MAFVAICTALYDYEPQSAEELQIKEGELLYILEKSTEDSWWRAKKKAPSDEEEEPEGLVPNNYVQDATATHTAKALYDYQRQTEEELSFAEDDVLHVFDTSDPDWSLVGLNGEFGFVPANYIDEDGEGGAEDEEEEDEVQSPPLPQRPSAPPVASPTEAESPRSAAADPAANIASILGGKAARTPLAPPPAPAPESPREPSEEEEEAPPPMPARPSAPQVASPSTTREEEPTSPITPGVISSPPANRVTRGLSQSAGHEGPGGYHLYNINEMVAVMGKMKKMPTTLGINLGMGVILVMPEKKRDGPQQEWAAENLTHYSIEGKHVFMEMVKPSRSFDFHAGAKDTATEIVASLGELAGVANYKGLQDEVAKTPGQKRGQMLYDFMAQGDDEVTVADGDEVIILDDTLSEEWWKVRRVSNGKEGVVPSSYVEVTGLLSPPPQPKPATPVVPSGMSNVERNRREEERITREALEASKQREEQEARSGRRTARTDSRTTAKGKPDQAKLRTWTDRSGTFKVEAQFLGLKDGKIHLHKVNGVKIAVPIAKMSKTDIEYVERMTGRSLDDVKPLADVRANGTKQASSSKGASQQPSKPEYDWFDFFLKCGVSPYQCERYSYNFSKDSMDESVLPDINPTVLRNLGLKEGDILRVMKYLDAQFNRKSKGVSFAGEDGANNGEGEDSGSLFAGPGGALKNNRKGRPAPAVQTNDTIDSKLLERGGSSGSPMPQAPDRSESPEDKPPKPPAKDYAFEDNAWDVKPAKQAPQQPIRARTASPQAASPPPLIPKLTAGMQDITLLTQPLQPTKASPQQSQPAPIEVKPAPAPQQPSQQGASPAFFSQLNPQQTGLPQQQQGQFQFNPPRQRPQAPQMAQSAAMMAPNRPLSAPGASPNNPMQPPTQGPPLGVGYHMTSASPPPNMNQMQQMQPMQTGFPGLNQQQQFQSQMQPQMQPQATGFQQQGFVNGQPAQSPFANQPIQAQATGFQPGFQAQQSILPQATGVNNMLPPALQPQPTAVNGFGRPAFGQPPVPSIPSQFGGQHQQQQQQPAPPVPPIPQQSTPAPLLPQQTGPAPNVRFGMHADAKKLITQPTGRRANLAQATPNNPFGF